MYLLKKSENQLVLEGIPIPLWAVVLYFAGVFAGLIVQTRVMQDKAHVLAMWIIAGILLVIAPFMLVARITYERLVIETGNRVQKFSVNPLKGPRLILDLPWESINCVKAEKVEERDNDLEDARIRFYYAWQLTVVLADGTTLLGTYQPRNSLDNPESLKGPREILQTYLKHKVVFSGG